MDDEELESYKLRKRTEFEQMVKMKRHYLGSLYIKIINLIRKLDKICTLGRKYKRNTKMSKYFWKMSWSWL